MLYPSVGSRGRYLDSPGHCLSSCGVSHRRRDYFSYFFKKKRPEVRVSKRVVACQRTHGTPKTRVKACCGRAPFFFGFWPEKNAKLTVSKRVNGQCGNVSWPHVAGHSISVILQQFDDGDAQTLHSSGLHGICIWENETKLHSATVTCYLPPTTAVCLARCFISESKSITLRS